MRILVVGGTRYFGIPMVNFLIKNGHEIMIATRGNSKPVFDGPVEYAVMDRTDGKSVKTALGGRNFDLIIDKIAYSSNDVKTLLGNVSCDRYIQMSTCSVYPKDHAGIMEDEYQPEKYELHDKEMAFIHEKDAGNFIAYLADHFVSGPINGCSKETVKISDITKHIEKRLGKKAVINKQGDDAPYNGLEDTLSFNTEKAELTGYRFRELKEWLYPLIDVRTTALD